MKEKYTAAQIIEALREKHGNLSAASRYLGCSRDTVRRYINTYPTVKAVAIQRWVDVTGGKPEVVQYYQDNKIEDIE